LLGFLRQRLGAMPMSQACLTGAGDASLCDARERIEDTGCRYHPGASWKELGGCIACTQAMQDQQWSADRT
jgi:hypothetical protein